MSGDKITVPLTENEIFAIRWCYSHAMKYVEKHSPNKNPYEHLIGPLDLIVSSVNISETIKNLLGRLVV
jgi:hypothetical protein